MLIHKSLQSLYIPVKTVMLIHKSLQSTLYTSKDYKVDVIVVIYVSTFLSLLVYKVDVIVVIYVSTLLSLLVYKDTSKDRNVDT
jgi:hypothetical protein